MDIPRWARVATALPVFSVVPHYCPELNPVEEFGRLLKASTDKRLYDNPRQLEDHLIAIAREWTEPGRVHSLIHCWMRNQANAGAPT